MGRKDAKGAPMTSADDQRTTGLPGTGRRLKGAWAWLDAHRPPVGVAVGVAVAALLVAATLWAFAAGPTWWLAVVLFLVAVPYVFSLGFFSLSRNRKETLLEHLVTAVAVTLTSLLVGAIVLWVFVNFIWAAEDDLPIYRRETLDAAGGQAVTVTLTYPRVVLIGNRPAELHLTLETTTDFNPPPRVVVRLPGGLSGQWLDDGQEPILTAGGPVEGRVALVNNRALPGLRPGEALTVELGDKSQTGVAPLSLPIDVEGQRGFAIRRFVNSRINEASPLIFLLVLVVPGVAALVQRAIDRRYGELRARRRREFDQHTKRFRAHFLVNNLKEARQALDKMNDALYGEFDAGERETATELLSFANLEFVHPPQGSPAPGSAAAIMEIGPRWPEEYAVAYVEAWRQLSADVAARPPAERHRYLRFFREARVRMDSLALSETSHARLRLDVTFWEQRALEPDLLPTQSRRWPPDVAKAPPPLSPFASGDAAESGEALFLTRSEEPAFSAPARFDELLRLERSWFVHGPVGCGRTALATVLMQRISSTTLAIKLERPLRAREMAHRLMRQKLRFVMSHPLVLSYLERDQWALLGRLLVKHLGADKALVAINEGLMYGDAIDAVHDLPEEDKTFARIQFQRLKAVVRQASERQETNAAGGRDAPSEAWPEEIVPMARALGFKRVGVIVDGNAGSDKWFANTFINTLAPQLFDWRDLGLRLVLLAPDSKATSQTAERLAHHGLASLRLAWTAQALKEMVNRRILAFTGRRHLSGRYTSLNEYIDDVILHSRVDNEPNPRGVIQVLRQMEEAREESDDDSPFTPAEARAALQVLKLMPPDEATEADDGQARQGGGPP